MYQPKPTDAFYSTVKIFRYLYYYPSKENEHNLKRFYAVSVILRILTSFVWIECSLHCYMSFKNNIPVEISADLAGVVGVGNGMAVCILFQINAKEWSSLYQNIIDTSKFGTPKNFVEVIKKTNRYSSMLFWYINIGLAIYAANSIFNTGHCKRINKEEGLHEICGTITPVWWSSNEIAPGTKIAVILYQIICIGSYTQPSAVAMIMPWVAVAIIVAKINHLKQFFKDAFDTKEKGLQSARLRFCIRYHQHIIRLTEDLSRAARRITGQMSCISAIILSCIATQMLKEYSIGAVIYLVGYLVSVFFICHAGQTILDETYDMQDAVYASKWYDIDPKIAKDIKLVLMRSQKPVCMEALPLGAFNYNVLIVIIKTSYSYLTLMYNTGKDGA